MESTEKGEGVSQIHAELDRKIEIVERARIVFTRLKLVVTMVLLAAITLYRVPADMMKSTLITLSILIVTVGLIFLFVPERFKTMVVQLCFLFVLVGSVTMALYSLNSAS